MDTFNEISASMGRDVNIIQGAGGNISQKRGGLLKIKASGRSLSEAAHNNIFVELPLDAVWRWMDEGNEKAAFQGLTGGLRPSIETPLHVLMPHPYVIHVHCVNTIARTVAADGALGHLMDGLRWQRLPYVRPGLPLALAIRKVMEQREADVLILDNHGLVAGAETLEEARGLVYEVGKRLEMTAPTANGQADFAFLRSRGGHDWEAPENALWQSLAVAPELLGVARHAPFYPDHVVFLGPALPLAQLSEQAEAAFERIREFGFSPVYLVYPGKGLLLSKKLSSSAKDMLTALALVAGRVPPNGPVRALTDGDIKELIGWDAELYRRAVAR